MPEPVQKQPAALTRPVRTAIQAAPAFVLTEFVDAFFHDLTERQYGALVALLLMLFSWGQVLVENKIGVGLLRDVNKDK